MVHAVAVSCVFFFKQKTAYEMRISDWSSDVCSSDLHSARGFGLAQSRAGLPPDRRDRGSRDRPLRGCTRLLATRSQPAGDRRKAPRLHARSAPCLARAAAGAGMKARTALLAGSVAFAVQIGRAHV